MNHHPALFFFLFGQSLIQLRIVSDSHVAQDELDLLIPLPAESTGMHHHAWFIWG